MHVIFAQKIAFTLIRYRSMILQINEHTYKGTQLYTDISKSGHMTNLYYTTQYQCSREREREMCLEMREDAQRNPFNFNGERVAYIFGY